MQPEPYYQQGGITVYHGDCRRVLAGLPACSVDSIVTDPPYELGFMGKAWDRSGVAFDPETWEAALRVLKPGGYLLAFGGTRTWHRIAMAIEDAGFEMRDSIGRFFDATPEVRVFLDSLEPWQVDALWKLIDSIFPSSLHWIYGSGFPKSLDVSKAIDRAAPRAGLHDGFAEHYAARRRAAGLTHHRICEIGGFFADHNHGGASVNWEKGNNVPTRAQWEVLKPLLGLSDEFQPLIERAEAERGFVGTWRCIRS